MTDVDSEKPPISRQEAVISDAMGRVTRLKHRARRSWFTDSVGAVQKAFEVVVAAAMVAVLFWACVAFYVVAREVTSDSDTASELRKDNASLTAEVSEWREQALLLEADNADLADELRDTEREVCP